MAIASVVSALVIAALVTVALLRLADKGQLDAAKWEPLTRWSVLRFLLGGLVETLKAAGVAMAVAIVVGALMALGRLARSRVMRWPGGVHRVLPCRPAAAADPVHGQRTPQVRRAAGGVLVPGAGPGRLQQRRPGRDLPVGHPLVDRGQSEAAFALGLGYWQAMLSVIVPQALRRMVPAIVSQLVTLLKDTSLGYVIAFEELLRRSRSSGEFFRQPPADGCVRRRGLHRRQLHPQPRRPPPRGAAAPPLQGRGHRGRRRRGPHRHRCPGRHRRYHEASSWRTSSSVTWRKST